VRDARKRIVSEGYEHAAERHAAWEQHIRVEEHARYIALLERLPEGAAVLELGCGNGVPVARAGQALRCDWRGPLGAARGDGTA
jgi:hypothetical protein